MEETIKNLREALRRLTTDWGPDGCSPPNYQRKNGLGEVMAYVDRWGFLSHGSGGVGMSTFHLFNPHNNDQLVLWSAARLRDKPNQPQDTSGYLRVQDFDDLDACVEYAKELCDAFLNKTEAPTPPVKREFIDAPGGAQ